jgi:NADPH:quinone reductase
LSLGETAEPRPGADEVLIDVHTASVSYMDYLMICGGYQMRPNLPYAPGTDAAGVVIACGEGVDRVRPGDRVSCANWFGGFAERMIAKASKTGASSRQCGFRGRLDDPARLSHRLVRLGRPGAARGR